MSAFSSVIQLDHWIFAQINQVHTHPWLDSIFPTLTDLHQSKFFIFGALPALLALFIYHYRGHAVKVLAGAVLILAVSDGVNHRLIKPKFQRQRPEFTLQNVQLRTHSHTGLSFPSNHATNSFAIASFVGFFTPWRGLLLTLAALIAYSRVYVGVHFPLDVLAGALTGLVISYWGRWAFQCIDDWWEHRKRVSRYSVKK